MVLDVKEVEISRRRLLRATPESGDESASSVSARFSLEDEIDILNLALFE
jgi:hypothetical protein